MLEFCLWKQILGSNDDVDLVSALQNSKLSKDADDDDDVDDDGNTYVTKMTPGTEINCALVTHLAISNSKSDKITPVFAIDRTIYLL